LPAGHQAAKPLPSHPTQATIKVDGAAAARTQKNSPSRPQVEFTEAHTTRKPHSQEVSSERKPSKEDEERRFAQAKCVNALAVSGNSESRAVVRAEPTLALVRWKQRRRTFRQLIDKYPLIHWAKTAYGVVVYSGLAFLLAASLIYAFRRNFGNGAGSQERAGQRARPESAKKQGAKRNSTKSTKAHGRTTPSQESGIPEGDTIGEPEAVNGVAEEREAEPHPLLDSGPSTTEKKSSPAPQTKPQAATPPAIEQKETQTPHPSSALRGLIFSMAIAKTVRSAYATTVTARIATDVRDAAGVVVIPAGTLVHVPLGAPDETGRFGSEPGATVWLILADGTGLTLKVSIQGADGSSGLAGRPKKSGRLGKLLRGIGEAGASLGQEFEGTRGAAQALEEALPERAEDGGAVAEIKSGTRFRLLVL
jgi:hypothetical protein